MSLITRCPSCGTMFKVVADQLKVSEGWVRCGHCDDVFDATANLQRETVPAPQPAAPAAAVAASLPAAATVSPDAAPQASAGQPRQAEERVVPSKAPSGPNPAQPAKAGEGEGFPSSIHSEVGDEDIAGFANSEELANEARALRADPLDQPFEVRRIDAPDVRDSGVRGQTQPAPLEFAGTLDDLSFVRQARRKAFWRRPAIRAGLVLVGLILGALLALQIAWQDRDRLAAAEPALRPWLLKLCEVAYCTIGPPRRIEAIAIDSSSFNKLRADTFRLNVALKNRATTEVAMPALELTLTDSQDQAVIRRVLPASELAGGTTTLQPGAEWSTSLVLAVSGSAGARVAGYRVLAFYP
jgi:predicted Zn finger-like uncharacterized protein